MPFRVSSRAIETADCRRLIKPPHLTCRWRRISISVPWLDAPTKKCNVDGKFKHLVLTLRLSVGMYPNYRHRITYLLDAAMRHRKWELETSRFTGEIFGRGGRRPRASTSWKACARAAAAAAVAPLAFLRALSRRAARRRQPHGPRGRRPLIARQPCPTSELSDSRAHLICTILHTGRLIIRDNQRCCCY